MLLTPLKVGVKIMFKGENSCGRANVASIDSPIDVENYFQIKKSVLAVKSIWQAQARKNSTTIETLFDKGVPQVLPINALKIQHCLNNLAANAVNSTRNGRVRIIVSLLNKPSSATGMQSYLVISVQDTGAGFSAQDMGTLFVKKSAPKTTNGVTFGIVDTGLPMTQNLITELGGKILVKSEIGKGSVFSLILPLSTSPSKQELADQTKVSDIDSYFFDLNILVVDDYNLNHLTLKALLQGNVTKVYTASHGYEALEVLQSCPIDLIFMDIHMPVLDGIETTLKIRESEQEWAGVHIIAMTADPDYQHMHLCRKIGMDDTLAKPFRVTDIYSILENFAPAYKIVASR
jgi:CheY-like chemotaxis protein